MNQRRDSVETVAGEDPEAQRRVQRRNQRHQDVLDEEMLQQMMVDMADQTIMQQPLIDFPVPNDMADGYLPPGPLFDDNPYAEMDEMFLIEMDEIGAQADAEFAMINSFGVKRRLKNKTNKPKRKNVRNSRHKRR